MLWFLLDTLVMYWSICARYCLLITVKLWLEPGEEWHAWECHFGRLHKNLEHKIIPMSKKCFLKGILCNLNILQSKQISTLMTGQKSSQVSRSGFAVLLLVPQLYFLVKGNDVLVGCGFLFILLGFLNILLCLIWITNRIFMLFWPHSIWLLSFIQLQVYQNASYAVVSAHPLFVKTVLSVEDWLSGVPWWVWK